MKTMKDWDFWGWAAYGSLFVAALIIAADATLKGVPDLLQHLPSFFVGQIWGYSPAILFIVGTAILIAKAWGWIGRDRPTSPTGYAFPEPYRPVIVRNKTFMNERVEVDGHAYEGCTFERVTISYNGTTPLSFRDCKFGQPLRIDSHSDAVKTSWLMLHALGMIDEARLTVATEDGKPLDRVVLGKERGAKHE